MRILGDPRRGLERYSQRVDDLVYRISLAMAHRARRDKARLGTLTGGLGHLNPLAILSRGYSITRIYTAGDILKNAADATQGTMISTKLLRGEVLSRIEQIDVDRDR